MLVVTMAATMTIRASRVSARSQLFGGLRARRLKTVAESFCAAPSRKRRAVASSAGRTMNKGRNVRAAS